MATTQERNLAPAPEEQKAPGDFEFQILHDRDMRIEYVTLTDELIRKMIQQGTDVAIYLDKSGRPVSWLVDELWDQLAPPQDTLGNPHKRPETKFVNIDRNQWGAIVGRSQDKGGIHMERMPRDRIEELQRVFAPEKSTDQSLFTGKNLMIVDEVSGSGDTLTMAEGIFKMAFPDAKSIDGEFWMDGKIDPNTQSNTVQPAWYSKADLRGRLVNERDYGVTSHKDSSRQKHGGYWLSTIFTEQQGRDLQGRQLRKEAAELAEELRRHDIPYIHSIRWGEDWSEPVPSRILRINGMKGIGEYIELKNRAKATGTYAVQQTVEKPGVVNNRRRRNTRSTRRRAVS